METMLVLTLLSQRGLYVLNLAHHDKLESSPMRSEEELAALTSSSEYAKAVEAYSNKFVNGAGMQKPGTRGFELWLIYSTHTKQTGNPPTLREAIDLAKEYGLNTTSAANALGKWSAYYGFRPPRKGDYSLGPRSYPFDPVPIQQTAESGLGSISKKRVEMSIVKVPAAVVRQGDLTLFTTSIKVRDLIVPGFYSVETLDPDNANDSGYQRLLNTARAKRLADYIVEGQDSKDAFLPTSVFLATDKSIPYDPETHFITIDLAEVGPFGVVDGQHRLEGLRLAAARDERVLDFDVAVNIANALPKIHQMCHFLIVNTTQKSVEAGVEQRIIARLTEAIDIEDLPMLPKWIRKRVELGDVAQAIRLADYLNQAEDSPWKGKVTMANAAKEGSTINQKSLVKAIVKYVLTANNPLNAFRDFEKEKKIFLNYWKAIAALLDDGSSAVLYKYNGVELFCKFSIPFFMKLQVNGNFTVRTQTELLQNCLNNVEGDYAGVGHPEWWASGGKASFLNSGAINQVAGAMGTALNTTSMSSKIEI